MNNSWAGRGVMIDPDFVHFNENGLYCQSGDFYLDPVKPVRQAVISHAHGDHAVKGNQGVYCTPPTAAIMRLRYKKTAAVQFMEQSFHDPFFINGVKLTFLPAGHILGSAQVLMEWDGTAYLYTGDIKIQDDPTCELVEFCKADVLITETTFADPAILHPDPAVEVKKLGSISFPILLGAYSLGKSQRLINLINRYCPEKRIAVHYTIDPINKLYAAFSYDPGKWELYTRQLSKNGNQEYIYIVPPLTFNSYIKAKNLVRVFASGWKGRQVKNGTELYISDHADWNDLLLIIGKTAPSEVWTLHGNGAHLKKHFEGRLTVKILNT